MRSFQRVAAVSVMVAASVTGCGILSGPAEPIGDEDTSGDGDPTGDPEPDMGEPEPERGFLVYPKYMLVDVQAIVTLEDDGVTVVDCPPADGGGYLCVTDGQPLAGFADVVVVRDGFDTTVQLVEYEPEGIIPVEVHLAVEGGPPGTWSECTPTDQFTTCDELCGAAGLACLVTSCASGFDKTPIATFETFAGSDCLVAETAETLACDATLPDSTTTPALRCCCG